MRSVARMSWWRPAGPPAPSRPGASGGLRRLDSGAAVVTGPSDAAMSDVALSDAATSARDPAGGRARDRRSAVDATTVRRSA